MKIGTFPREHKLHHQVSKRRGSLSQRLPDHRSLQDQRPLLDNKYSATDSLSLRVQRVTLDVMVANRKIITIEIVHSDRRGKAGNQVKARISEAWGM